MTTSATWHYENFERTGSAIGYRSRRSWTRCSRHSTIEIYESTTGATDAHRRRDDADHARQLYHEMMSHLALFTHANPKHVASSAAACGTLREVLKHEGVRHALQVEIDERVTRLSEQYFPELCVSNDDPRAGFFFGDGIRWMQESEPGSVDVIIVDSTDPVGPAEGLFTQAFYRDCLRALGENGILVQQSESPLYHMHIINPMRKAIRAAGFVDVQTLFFPQATYPSGWWSATMAGKQARAAVPAAGGAGETL
jgi:spermidine synthase